MIGKKKSLRIIIVNITLLFLSIFIFLVIFEIVLRVGFPIYENYKLFCYDSNYGWNFCKDVSARVEIKDYGHFIEINSKGWRDFEYLDTNKKNINENNEIKSIYVV